MSIPQICPCCSNHISEPHHPDCSFGTSEYAHLGWPNYTIPSDVLMAGTGSLTISGAPSDSLTFWEKDSLKNLKEPWWNDHKTAVERLLKYLEDEPEPMEELVLDEDPDVLCVLKKRSEELRKEAAGMYNVEARTKRIFAADILTQIVEELQAAGE